MPQADLLSFTPTLLTLPVCFLGGYFFFATYWAPRIMLTLRCRHWLTRVGSAGVAEGAWPEIFLMFLQFGGLLFFISLLQLVTPPEGLLIARTPEAAKAIPTGTTTVENFFLLWGSHREVFLFRPAGVELTYRVEHLLGGFGFFHPGKQFTTLENRLQLRFTQLSLEGKVFHGG